MKINFEERKKETKVRSIALPVFLDVSCHSLLSIWKSIVRLMVKGGQQLDEFEFCLYSRSFSRFFVRLARFLKLF